jgi:hypothetical protein
MQIVSAVELVVFAQGKALFAMIEKTHANKKQHSKYMKLIG